MSKSSEFVCTITIFDVINYMMRHSSPERKLSISEISIGMTEYAYIVEENQKFNSISATMDAVDEAVSANRTYDKCLIDLSIKRQVSRLIHKYLDQELILGITIRCDDRVENCNAFSQVYYISHVFDDMQVNMLRDAVSIYPYAETSQTSYIVDKLNQITPLYNRESYNPELVSAIKYPGTYFENLYAITKAFSKVKLIEKPTVLVKEHQAMRRCDYDKTQKKGISKIKFIYCAYDVDKKLTPRFDRSGNAERIVNPVKLMWVNGYYYLVTFDDRTGNYINYRVDRMKQVVCLDEDAVTPLDFSADKYRYSNPIMYSCKHHHNSIKIRCKKSILNNAFDTFGFDIHITPLQGTDEVMIDLFNISTIGVKMWALEYGYGAEIISPPDLRREMLNSAEHLLKIYHRD